MGKHKTKLDATAKKEKKMATEASQQQQQKRAQQQQVSEAMTQQAVDMAALLELKEFRTCMLHKEALQESVAKKKSLMLERKRNELTEKSLNAIPPSGPLYQQMGRIFVLDNKENIIDTMKKREDTIDIQMSKLEKQHRILETKLKQGVDDLSEQLGHKFKNLGELFR